MTSTVLVTGGTGFVGSHVARLLVEQGVRVRALARPGSRLDNLTALDPRLLQVVNGDLTQPETLHSAVTGCSKVYHVAADYRLWSRNPDDLYRSNVDGTRALLAACAAANVERIVYTSTVGALGIPKDGSPGKEDTPVTVQDMVGHYKRSKFLAEEVAREFASNGLPVVIVNPTTPVGESDIKPTPTGKIVVDFLNGRLPAFVDTGLNLVDVRDVAEGILLAAERGRVGERYILGCRDTSLREMLGMLATIAGKKPPLVRIPYAVAYAAVGLENAIASALGREPTHPFEGVKMAKYKMFFDPAKARKELGLPQSSIEVALERAVAWFTDNSYVNA